MATNDTSNWLPEPKTHDNTWARRGEHTLDWLARSTLPRAQACRRFLNESLAVVPQEHQSRLFHDLRSRWKSAFFELIVIRTLQTLGASVVVEPANDLGKRPDFVAQFHDGSVTVEAISPVFNGEVGEQAKHRIPLLEIIEELTPEGWSVGVFDLPEIGPTDSRKEFRQAVRKLLALPPAESSLEQIELHATLTSGDIHLLAIPRRYDYRAVVVEPPLGCFDTTEERIRYALKKKSRQVKGANMPVLLAVEASGIASDFEDFDFALFGRTCDVLDREGNLSETKFISSGVFASSTSDEPTFAGVLAFLEVGFRGGPDPVLYLHPRFKGNVPNALLKLEQRRYTEESGILVQASEIAGFRDSMEFVPRAL